MNLIRKLALGPMHPSTHSFIYSNKFIEHLADSRQCAQLRGTLHICLHGISITVLGVPMGQNETPKRSGRNWGSVVHRFIEGNPGSFLTTTPCLDVANDLDQPVFIGD